MPPVALGAPDLDELHYRPLPIITQRLDDWWRVSAARYRTVVHFGKGRVYRFDDPLGDFGVLYAGGDYLTCVAESVLRDELRTGARPLYLSDLEERVIARLAGTDPVRLVDLTEAIGIGLDNQITTIPDYSITQAWSRALYDHPEAPDGLYYTSRNYPKGQAIAVFDRALARLDIQEAPGTRFGLRQAPEYASLLQLLMRTNINLC